MNSANVILIVKHIVALILLAGVIVAPAWIARQNKKSGIDMVVVRLANWMFGWTGIGYLISLFWGAKK